MSPIRLITIVSLSTLAAACAPAPQSALCVSMGQRCGGQNPAQWQAWCESDCVPEYARTVPCDQNDACVLCDRARTDQQTTYFGLPNDELEYMWTLIDAPDEPHHPATEPAPTGTAFHDGPDSFQEHDDQLGSWLALQPYGPLELGEPMGFCEPGPNQFVRSNASDTGHEMVLRAQLMPPEYFPAMYCDYPDCPWGPYQDCGGPSLGQCQYGDEPEMSGIGSAAQVDRLAPDGSAPSYGYGRFRAVLRASDGAGAGPQPGAVYAFFSQSNEYCANGTPNLDTNTSELDVEISSGPGRTPERDNCDESQMCLQLSTWVSSVQGIANGARGVERHEVSGFRFREMAVSGNYHTYGWDWREDEVRFTYDSNPDDCDEAGGECSDLQGSIAICRHVRFVPRRPSPMHVQLWNARWAGHPAPGTRTAMSIRDVWHEPAR